MQAYTLDLTGGAIELEAAFARHFDGADAEFLRHLVEQLTILHVSDAGCV